MTVDSMTQIVGNFQSIYTIVSALAIAEGFNQAIRADKPTEEKPATTLVNWFDCIHPSRFMSLLVFLMLAVPFYQGNQKYLYLQYIEPLHSPHPPKSISALRLNCDCLVFTLEAGLFFVMSRSLSARRCQQFYATIVVLLLVDAVWAAIERIHGFAVPASWLWFDLIVSAILSFIIAMDWFFVPYERDKRLNHYCYWGASILAVIALAYGYIYELDYLID
jgi:hypothetical protein